MSIINSIQSMLPRPENRSRDQIARDLDDEFNFHLEMKARALQSEDGLDRDAACGLARDRFGNLDQIKRDCQRIALRERIMLQRVNLVLMIVVMLVVIAVGAQVYITQRYNTLALQAITADLARMKFEAASAAREGGANSTPGGASSSDAPNADARVIVEGHTRDTGWHAIDMQRGTLMRDLLNQVGVQENQWITYRRDNMSTTKPATAYLKGDAGLRILRPGEEINVQDDSEVNESVKLSWHLSQIRNLPRTTRWHEISADGSIMKDGWTLSIGDDAVSTPNTMSAPTMIMSSPLATPARLTVIMTAGQGAGLTLMQRGLDSMFSGDWTVEQGRLVFDCTDLRSRSIKPDLIDLRSVPQIARRIVFQQEDAAASTNSSNSARAAAVGDFVVRLFALADPSDPNLNQTIRNFLDAEEKAVDQKYAGDPATAGMIRELIAARRKIFEADANALRAETAEMQAQAISDFLKDMLVTTDTTAPSIKVSDVLDNASKRIEDQFADNPELQAQMRERIAEAQKNLQAPDAGAGETPNREGDDEYPELSPFRAVRWKDYTPFVNVMGTWGELVSIDDVAAAEIVDFCRRKYGDKDRKRFTEDLVQVMAEMGKPLSGGAAVKLRIKEYSSGTVMSIERAAMTEDNRRALWDANNDASENTPPYPAWSGQPPPDSTQQSGAVPSGPEAPVTLTLEQARADVATLETAMQERFSYLHLRDVDLAQALTALRSKLTEGMATGDFAFELQKFIVRFGDGHAGVGGLRDFTPPAYAPFQMRAAHDNRIVAFAADSAVLLDPSHPYLVSINDIPIEKLLNAAKAYVVDGSPALVRRRSIEIVHRLGLLAREPEFAGLGPAPGAANGPDIVVELASATPADGTVRQSLGPALKSPLYQYRSDRASGLIADGQVGYIRLAEMDEESARMAKWLMPQFKNTRGLIIDVRGNGGGSRDALLTLLPHVLKPDAPPLVLNIAAYRLNDAFEEDHLDSRFMYRRDDAHWGEAERAAIDAAMAKFEPKWLPPEGLKDNFSDWHYLIISRAEAAKANPDVYHYDKPVIVLLDGECFSATDIFLGAFKGLPNVTLLGTASSGGSGRKQSVRLPQSGLTMSLSSMISYLPDGSMFDLRGVEPDVIVEPIPTDFVLDGETDSQLDAALARLP